MKVPFTYAERRQGDPAQLVSSYEKAKDLLSWSPKRGIDNILTDAWKWHSRGITHE